MGVINGKRTPLTVKSLIIISHWEGGSAEATSDQPSGTISEKSVAGKVSQSTPESPV